MADTTLQFILEAQDRASQTIKQVEANIGGFSKTVEDMQPVFSKMAIAGGVAFAGISAAVYTSISAARESADIHAQLNSVLASTKGVAGITADAALNLADSLKKVTVYDDDAILSGENLLLTFTNIGKDVFPDATRAMLDMSKSLGQDLKSSAIQLGKALQDPVLGVSALRRVGVNFSQDQQDMIKTMVATGHTMDAQKYILRELKTEFGGSADINDFGDRMEKLKQSIEDTQKAIGFALEPALTTVLARIQPIINNIMEWTSAHPQLTANLLLAAGAVSGLVLVIGTLGMLLPGVIAAFTFFTGPIGLVMIAIGALTAGVIVYRDEIAKILTQIEENTGILAQLKSAWDSIVDTFNTYLMPALAQLWAAMQPLKPFFEALGIVIGVTLVVAIKALIAIITGWIQLFTVLLSIATQVATFFTSVFAGAINSVIGTIASAIDYVERLISAIQRLNILQAAQNFASSAVKAVTNVVKVNDAVISPSGSVVSTAPDDWLIATKTPGALAGAGGGSVTININGGNYLSEDAALILGDQLVSVLRRNMRI